MINRGFVLCSVEGIQRKDSGTHAEYEAAV